ncbi:hypothetical protein KBP30_40950 [Streptomyces sp. Go40/10]|uniref:hypothetical protein n=1 Tax=Streptomyces sp. Go40/10 TaxID=2825844 RepID=UPI001E494AA6|nr:hypothetical protein [Streptomyces sp. Go40/10]UFR07118.1 hypothetical protein KBP30_40950 [Streptomyces sp. Go40/10]
MSESTAALWAAAIGAAAATLVGGMAFWAAMRQVRLTALVQREQAFWQFRRDTYAKFMGLLAQFDRIAQKHLAAHHRGNFTEEQESEMSEALLALHQGQCALMLECPGDPYITGTVGGISGVVQSIVTGFTDWRYDVHRISPRRSRDDWVGFISEKGRYLQQLADELFQALRNDLHREVGVERENSNFGFAFPRWGGFGSPSDG